MIPSAVGAALPLLPQPHFAITGRGTRLSNKIPLLAKVLIAMPGPPIVTIICWLAGPLLAGARRKRTRKRSWVEFRLMLLAAYLVFAIAFLRSTHRMSQPLVNECLCCLSATPQQPN